MPSNTVYMIVLMDSASDSYTYGVFDEGVSSKAYKSLDDAKSVLVSASENYDEFLPTAYGKAFPYDSVTFDQQLEKDGFAPWGWGVEETENGSYRICLGLITVSIE